MHHIKTNLLVMILGLILSNLAHAASLIASVDRNKITINDTLTLQLRYDQSISGDQLDLRPLRQDFDVLGSSPRTSSSMRIINGQTTREELTIWTITLAPKHQGMLVIPSFNLKGTVSNAIRIDVAEASAAIRQDQPIRVNLSTNTKTAHPGQQILIKVELVAKNSVSSLSGDQLRLDNADIELLDQKSSRRIENGISWQVVEWVYAVFPQQTGDILLPPQLFSGELQSAQQRNRFDPFRQQRGQRISARSSAETIRIEDIPNTNGLPWFPADNVRIESSWSGDTSQMRVGDSLTRTIQIIAAGQRANVIPPLPENSALTYKAYKDQPQLQNQPSSAGIVGIRQESEAIVPSAAGLLEVPEQRVNWWDTASKSWQEAILPAETFEVLPALQSNSFAPPSGPVQFLPEQSTTTTLIEATSIWWKIATALLGIICLLQFWLLMRNKPLANDEHEHINDSSLSRNKAWKELQKQLKKQAAQQIRSSLLNWLQAAWPNAQIINLQSASKYLEQHNQLDLAVKLAEQVKQLDACLYNDSADFDSRAISSVAAEIDRFLNTKKTKSEKLVPLYPK